MELSLNDIRELLGVASASSPLIGKPVVVRSSPAGVFIGRCEAITPDGRTVTIKEARKLHSWEGAFAVEGIAIHGAVSGRFTSVCPRIIVSEVCQIVQATEEALRACLGVSEYKP